MHFNEVNQIAACECKYQGCTKDDVRDHLLDELFGLNVHLHPHYVAGLWSKFHIESLASQSIAVEKNCKGNDSVKLKS